MAGHDRVNLHGKWIQNPQRCSASKVLAAATRGTQAQPPQSGPPSHQMFRLALGQVHLTISKFGRRQRKRESLTHSPFLYYARHRQQHTCTFSPLALTIDDGQLDQSTHTHTHPSINHITSQRHTHIHTAYVAPPDCFTWAMG